jgi:hypothetical protein
VQVGDAITLKLHLEGEGNLRKIPLPTLPRLEGWKVYEPKVSVQMSHADVIGGSKSGRIFTAAGTAGQTTMPPPSFSYFDTQKAAYATAKTNPIQLTVTGQAMAVQSTQAPAATATPGTSASENLLALDVRPLRTRPSLRRDLGSALYHSPACSAWPSHRRCCFGWSACRHGAHAPRTRDGRQAPAQVAPLGEQAPAHGHRPLHENRLAPSLGEIERVLSEFLTGKVGRPVSGMSRDELRAALASWAPVRR